MEKRFGDADLEGRGSRRRRRNLLVGVPRVQTFHAAGAGVPAAPLVRLLQGAGYPLPPPLSPHPERCFCGFFFHPQVLLCWKHGVRGRLSTVLCTFQCKTPTYALKPPGVSLPGLLSHPVGMITSDLLTLEEARRRTLCLEVAYF